MKSPLTKAKEKLLALLTERVSVALEAAYQVHLENKETTDREEFYSLVRKKLEGEQNNA